MAKKVKGIIEGIPDSDAQSEGDGSGEGSGGETREDQDTEREKEDSEEIHDEIEKEKEDNEKICNDIEREKEDREEMHEMEKNEDSVDTHQLLNELSALANLDANCEAKSHYRHVGQKRYTRSSARK